MNTPLIERAASSRDVLDPLTVLLHADDVREGCRRVLTERKYRWVKELQWWRDLSEQLEMRGEW